MARPKIKLFVDTVSPFAYEAYYILRHDPVFKPCDVSYLPIFLGGLMKICGNTAPINIKNKDKWIATERLRWAKAFAIPMKDETPPSFPPLTLGIMRALSVIDLADGDDQGRLTAALDALFHDYWVDHKPTHQPDVLSEVLARVLGGDEAANMLSRAGTEGKQLLAANTDKAFESGAFGLPWMVCTSATGETEGFWGVDHLGQVIQFLGLDRPAHSGWKAVL